MCMKTPGQLWAVLCVIVSCTSPSAQVPETPSAVQPASTLLTTTESVQKLSPDEAAKGLPIRLRGVVTFSQEWWRLLFVEDSTGGIFCEPAVLPAFPEAGREVEIEGISGTGAYLPVVIVTKLRVLGPAPFPQGAPVTPGQLWKGRFDGDMVRVSGYVSAVTAQKAPTPFLDIRLLGEEREMNVWVLGSSNTPPETLLGSYVEVQGVFGPKIDDRGQITGIGILSSRPEFLRIITTCRRFHPQEHWGPSACQIQLV